MKISIVTISYNQAAFLPECMESVLRQDFGDIEYIVVDAGSSDGSREIIEGYADRLSNVVMEPDRGPADGLNKGFNLATGDVFAFINADDVMLPGATSYVADYFARRPEIDVVMGNGVQLDEYGKKQRRLFSTKWSLRRHAYGAFSMVQQSTFFRRKAFEDAGGFNIDNRISWDGELLVDMARSGARFARVSRDLGAFRVHNESITGSGGHKSQGHQDAKSRIAEKALGRTHTTVDRVLSAIYVIAKYVFHPIATLHGVWWRAKKLLGS